MHDGFIGIGKQRANRDSQDFTNSQEHGNRNPGFAAFREAHEALSDTSLLRDVGYRKTLAQAGGAKFRTDVFHPRSALVVE